MNEGEREKQKACAEALLLSKRQGEVLTNCVHPEFKLRHPVSASEKMWLLNKGFLSRDTATTLGRLTFTLYAREKYPITKAANGRLDEFRHIYEGVVISSRYDCEHELRELRSIIDIIGPVSAKQVDEMFCDSKGSSFYTITMKGEDRECPFMISASYDIEEAFKLGTGFNGIAFELQDGRLRDVSSYWR